FGVKDSVDEFQKKKYSFIVEVFKAMERFSVRHADVVITPSDYFNRLVKGWFSGGGGESVNTDKRTNKVITIYNGIDLNETFEKLPKYNEKTIISAGRLVPGKGFDLLIRIMKDMPEWKLHIVGEGPDEETLMRLAKDNSVESRVLFLGKLPRLELFSEIYRSHVFALLSESESFSFQIVEAMFVGTPVIATRVGAIPELIENGKDGILINRADSVNFRDEAERLVNDSYYATRISQNARLKVEHFSINNTVDQLYRICENVVAK
ncbi:MAG: glycosyltransferase family 4 protein, partial [Nanoarchaeota archaeon]|nr:glycosyltransferase family 4 protein [Nanoarchaeota archaeon]